MNSPFKKPEDREEGLPNPTKDDRLRAFRDFILGCSAWKGKIHDLSLFMVISLIPLSPLMLEKFFEGVVATIPLLITTGVYCGTIPHTSKVPLVKWIGGLCGAFLMICYGYLKGSGIIDKPDWNLMIGTILSIAIALQVCEFILKNLIGGDRK